MLSLLSFRFGHSYGILRLGLALCHPAYSTMAWAVNRARGGTFVIAQIVRLLALGRRLRDLLSFPGHQRKMTWKREETRGNWYGSAEPPMEGWLCPALFQYFEKAQRSFT
jgi:hypothetical protein